MKSLSGFLFLLLVFSAIQAVPAQESRDAGDWQENDLLLPSIKTWVHFVKTGQFVDHKIEPAVAKISDVSRYEVFQVYTYLQTKMDVWNVSSIARFSTNLYVLKWAKEEGSLDIRNFQHRELDRPIAITFLYGNGRQELSDEQVAKIRIEAENTAYDIRQMLK